MLHAIVLASVVLGSGAVASAATASPDEEPGAVAREGADDPGATASRDAAIARALRMVREHHYEQAVQLLQALSAEYPAWPTPYFYMGSIYFEGKRWESALQNFDRALQLSPGLHKARLLNGWCLIYLGQLEAARGLIEAYLRAVPDSADARFALGLIEMDEDNVDAARSLLTEAIEMTRALERPAREASIRARYADLLVRTGEIEAAKRELGRSLELDPTDEKVYFKLSRVLQRLGDDEGARMARENNPEVLKRLDTVEAEP